MKCRAIILCLVTALLLSQRDGLSEAPEKKVAVESGGIQPASSQFLDPSLPIPTEAHRLALLSAHSLNREGFRIRDGEWASSLHKGEADFLKLTLLEGNHYWFVMASPVQAATIRMTLYDSHGHPVICENRKETAGQIGTQKAIGLIPAMSGQYYLGIKFLDSPSDQSLDFSLVSAYK